MRKREKMVAALMMAAAVVIGCVFGVAGMMADRGRAPKKKQDVTPGYEVQLPEIETENENVPPVVPENKVPEENEPEQEVDLSLYPQELAELYENNPEARDFVLSYFDEKDISHEIDLSEYENCDEVPLFMQWDKRWGYESYNDSIIALAGCGPTCMSMVTVYLTGDSAYNPLWMSNFSERHGYNAPGNGTAWLFFSEGAEILGLASEELIPMENIVAEKLQEGKPVVCVMGPGDFTESGHYIVLTGYEDGMVSVNDPNSRERSQKMWKYSDIVDQIRNLWAISLPEVSQE